eukprot:21127-Heterococcus_DN1.PRE.1
MHNVASSSDNKAVKRLLSIDSALMLLYCFSRATAAAAIWTAGSIYAALRGADVTLTDMDTEKCRESIDVNFTPRGLLLDTLQVVEVVWGVTDLQPLKPPFDIILAG